MSTDFGQVQRRRQNRNTRGFGISQNLSNRNEYARVPRIQYQNIQNPRRINIVRPTNRRAVMKFAKKRVQRARLQLNKRIAFRPNANRRAVLVSINPKIIIIIIYILLNITILYLLKTAPSISYIRRETNSNWFCDCRQPRRKANSTFSY
jgi:hypothetical protein